jgi:hypothetical protein
VVPPDDPTNPPAPSRRGALTLLTREGCELCELFLEDLQRVGERVPLPPLDTRIVDDDPEWIRRFGHRIPVLLWDGVPVATGRIDPDEIERLFRARQPL